MIRICLTVFTFVAFAVVLPQAAQAQGKKKDPPAKKSHVDAMKAAMSAGFKEVKDDIKGVKDDVLAVKDDVKKSDSKLDQILAKQAEHDAEFKAIREGQLMLARQLKEGFEGLGTELAEVKKIAQQKTNVTVNNVLPETKQAPPEKVYVDRVVHVDRIVEKPVYVYVDRVVYKDRVVVQTEYVDRYVHIAVPYRAVGCVPYYGTCGRFIGYSRP